MRSRDIHYGKPTVINAVEHLELFLKEVKRSESIVEVAEHDYLIQAYEILNEVERNTWNYINGGSYDEKD